MRRFSTAALVIVAVGWSVGTSGVPAQTVAPAPEASLAAALAVLDGELAAEFAEDGIGGASIGVVFGPDLIWSRHFGFADAELERPPTDDTVYRIGSITKQFTALALLQAVEAGRARLTDPVARHVPEVRLLQDAHAGSPPITLLQLATMTAGVAREPDCERPLDGPVDRWTGKLLECLPGTRFAREPGTAYLYSNIGYAILGLAVERASGAPFTTVVEQQIFRPLGMTRSGFEPTPELRRDLARGYSRPRRRAAPSGTTGDAGARQYSSAVADRELEGRGYKIPNGAILSSVGDLAKFVAWELGEGPDGVLDAATQAANYQRVYSATNTRGELTLSSGYGLGFQASRRGDKVFLGHGGSTAGYHAAAEFHRASRLGVVVLRGCDSCSFDAGPVARRMLERLTDVVALPSRPDVR